MSFKKPLILKPFFACLFLLIMAGFPCKDLFSQDADPIPSRARRHILKLNLISPIANTFEVAYEWLPGKRFGLQAAAGYMYVDEYRQFYRLKGPSASFNLKFYATDWNNPDPKTTPVGVFITAMAYTRSAEALYFEWNWGWGWGQMERSNLREYAVGGGMGYQARIFQRAYMEFTIAFLRNFSSNPEFPWGDDSVMDPGYDGMVVKTALRFGIGL